MYAHSLQLDRDNIVQQRVSEAVEKYKLQMTEEKQRLLLEASKQLRDAVSSVKEEMEGKVRQAQSLAMQEAMKEVNTQSSSKEVRDKTKGKLGSLIR